MHRFVVGLILLTATGTTQAKPEFWAGLQVVRQVTESWSAFYDSSGQEVIRLVYDDPYWGIGCQLEFSPVSFLRLRLDLAELRFFSAGGGAFVAFPAVGLNASVTPPVAWQVIPYALAGGRYTGYWGWQGEHTRLDPRFVFGRDYRLWAGLGARTNLTPRLGLNAEAQLWDSGNLIIVHHPIIWEDKITSFGVHKLKLGATFSLPSVP